MIATRLRLVVNNPDPISAPLSIRSHLRRVYPVPDSDLEIRRIVKQFSDFLLANDRSNPVKYLEDRRKYDTSEVIGSIYSLSPRAADRLQSELKIIAELSLHPSIRHAAIRKLVEIELSQ